MISNQPTKSYANVLSDNFININKSINSINSDMHAIKINDENTVFLKICLQLIICHLIITI